MPLGMEAADLVQHTKSTTACKNTESKHIEQEGGQEKDREREYKNKEGAKEGGTNKLPNTQTLHIYIYI